MIRLRKKIGSAIPPVLQTRGVDETQLLIDTINAGTVDLEFKSSIYGHDEVKTSLIELQDHKCCFCEAFIGHISYGDVEHYRPKGGWVQNGEPINKPGYYWLAYNWDNLFLSCQLCNQRFKKNYFPLVDNAARRIGTRDITAEEPVFVHPVDEDPEEFISFIEEIPVGIDDEGRGEQTVKKLGLDRELLNEDRRRLLNKVRDIYDLAKGYPETYPELRAKAIARVQKYLDDSKLDETEYASMLRCFFNVNPL